MNFEKIYLLLEGPKRNVGKYSFELDGRFVGTALIWCTALLIALSRNSPLLWLGFAAQTFYALGALYRMSPWGITEKLFKKKRLLHGGILFAVGHFLFSSCFWLMSSNPSVRLGSLHMLIAIAFFVSSSALYHRILLTKSNSTVNFKVLMLFILYLSSLFSVAFFSGILDSPIALLGMLFFCISDGVIFVAEVFKLRSNALNFWKQVFYWSALISLGLTILIAN